MIGADKRYRFEAWEKEDSQRLKNLWDIYKKQPKQNRLTLREIAIKYEIGKTAGSVSHYIQGVQPLNYKVALAFSDVFNVQLEAISPTFAKQLEKTSHLITNNDNEDEYSAIKRFNVQASAGFGNMVFEYNELEPLKMPKSYLSRLGITNPSQAFFHKVSGFSMEPLLPDGSEILVKRTTEIIDGNVYVFLHNNEIKVKKLKKTNVGLLVISVNSEYDTYIITDLSDVIIYGQVVLCAFSLL